MSDWDPERKLAEWITNLRLFVQWVDDLNRKLNHARAHFEQLKEAGLLPEHVVRCLELDGLLPLGPDPEVCRNCIHQDTCPDYEHMVSIKKTEKVEK